jgi:hypothetical protein
MVRERFENPLLKTGALLFSFAFSLKLMLPDPPKVLTKKAWPLWMLLFTDPPGP